MRTSPSQFLMMVSHMEQHGDIGNPPNPTNRLDILKSWEELGNLLNSDATGGAKSVEKWRKGNAANLLGTFPQEYVAKEFFDSLL